MVASIVRALPRDPLAVKADGQSFPEFDRGHRPLGNALRIEYRVARRIALRIGGVYRNVPKVTLSGG